MVKKKGKQNKSDEKEGSPNKPGTSAESSGHVPSQQSQQPVPQPRSAEGVTHAEETPKYSGRGQRQRGSGNEQKEVQSSYAETSSSAQSQAPQQQMPQNLGRGRGRGRGKQSPQQPPQVGQQPPPQFGQQPQQFDRQRPQFVQQPPPQLGQQPRQFVQQPPPQFVQQPPPQLGQQPRQFVQQPPPQFVQQPPPQFVQQPPPQVGQQPQQRPQIFEQKVPKGSDQQQMTQKVAHPEGRKFAPAGGTITKKTDETTKSLPYDFEKILISEKRLCRVAPGKMGRKINIETNHVSLNLGKLREAIHYDVNIDPPTPKKYLPMVMEKLRVTHFPNCHPAFDGRSNLYSPVMLPFGSSSISDEVTIKIDDREKTYKISVQFANKVDLTPLQNMLSQVTSPMEALQCVDIVLRSAPASRCITVGRSFFTKPEQIINLGGGMEMYDGFFQSAIRGWKPLLNIDVAHKAFPRNITVLDSLVEVVSSRFKQPDLTKPLSSEDLSIFSKYMRGLKVLYEIPGQPTSRRVYRVHDLDQPPSRKKFLHEGTEMTIEAYFQRLKNFRLRYPNLPTLWVGNKERKDRILLPLELCTIQEGQAVNRKMTDTQTSEMIKYAATDTIKRKKKIMNGLHQTDYNNHPCLREFGFTVGDKFEQLEARILQPPKLKYKSHLITPSRGVWRATDEFIMPGTLNKWTILVLDRAGPDKIEELVKMVINIGKQNGLFIKDPIRPFNNLRGNEMEIRNYFKGKNDFDLIIVIIPSSGPVYGYVKKAAEISVGCLTQCLKSRTLFKINPQTVANILLKVNSKLNGINHTFAERPKILNAPCMIMGADVTHPGPDSQNIPSVAAVTASHDPKAFKYNFIWRLQPPTVEIIEDLTNITKEQLMYFYRQTNSKPQRIVFFRDGVSEGQFQIVTNNEIRAIRNACKQMGDGQYQPQITFLVVQKRHHTRFFPDRKDSEDKNCNVPAGTCVDQIITNPMMQNFYLVSHASIQGVAKPTKYCTLADDNNMTSDEIEQLTYYLCHMFTRCNRSVSYPAPTYYAHLAAARGKVYVESEQLDMNNLQKAQEKFKIQEVIQKGKPMFFV